MMFVLPSAQGLHRSASRHSDSSKFPSDWSNLDAHKAHFLAHHGMLAQACYTVFSTSSEECDSPVVMHVRPTLRPGKGRGVDRPRS